jgi:hypothetical protein
MGELRKEDLKTRFREAGSTELLELVGEHLEQIDAGEVRQVLRSPFVTSQIIEKLITQRRLLSFHEVRGDLVRHPSTPEVHALRFVPGLFWKDLVDISSDIRVRPRIRRAADRYLVNRLQGLAAGERIVIARRAGPSIIPHLRNDPEHRVISALLENPRLTEGSLMTLVASESANPKALAVVARHRKWGSRYPIRVALCRNMRTPAQESITMLSSLKKIDLAAIERDRKLPTSVRRRAAVLLGRSLD